MLGYHEATLELPKECEGTKNGLKIQVKSVPQQDVSGSLFVRTSGPGVSEGVFRYKAADVGMDMKWTYSLSHQRNSTDVFLSLFHSLAFK